MGDSVNFDARCRSHSASTALVVHPKPLRSSRVAWSVAIIMVSREEGITS